jgi:hypothetical protein
VTNTRFLNISLITKWIWRLFNEESENQLWLKLIRAEYPAAANIFSSSPAGGSPFSHQIQKIKNFFKLGAKYLLGNGAKILLWTDWWSGNSPLSERFPRLFQICSNPSMSAALPFRDGRLCILFRCTFGPAETEQWSLLIAELLVSVPGKEMDRVPWAWSLRGFLDYLVVSEVVSR